VNVTRQFGDLALRARLRADHESIEVLMQRLLELCARNHVGQVLLELWGEFRTDLEAHIDAEEAVLFPSLVDICGREVRVLMAEHRHLRSRLQELEAAIRGGSTHLVPAFAHELRAHVASESKLLGHDPLPEADDKSPSSAPRSSSTRTGLVM
jgi:hypothetical protein